MKTKNKIKLDENENASLPDGYIILKCAVLDLCFLFEFTISANHFNTFKRTFAYMPFPLFYFLCINSLSRPSQYQKCNTHTQKKKIVLSFIYDRTLYIWRQIGWLGFFFSFSLFVVFFLFFGVRIRLLFRSRLLLLHRMKCSCGAPQRDTYA